MTSNQIDITTEVVRHSGARVLSALVDDGTGAWFHRIAYYWDAEDGDPREDFIADVIDRGWWFA